MDNTDSIIEKIKKAIRLANRTTSEGERDNAMRLAKRIADANGIAFDEVKASETATPDAIKETDEAAVNMRGSEVGFICYILREHFGVIAMFNTLKRQPSYATISWFGSRLNIEIAKYVWHILRRESIKAWQHARVDAVKARRTILDKYLGSKMYDIIADKDLLPKVTKQTFMEGFFSAIDHKLKECPLRNDLEEAKAKAEKKFQEFRNENNVQDKIVKNKKSDKDQQVFRMGLHAGTKVNLSRPCEGVAKDMFAITA